MKITLVHPEQALDGGNTVTARRWAQLLRALGHEIVAEGADLLVALHARKSAEAIRRFAGPSSRGTPGPVIVAATGTDLYQDLDGSPEALASFERAWRIVVLHPLAADALPAHLRARTRVVLQSVVATTAVARDAPYTIAVIAHLRAVKDPLAFAEAAALLPASSRIRVVHVGGALDADFAVAARAEAARNARYHWLGALPREEALRVLASAHLLGISSLAEGGANVIGEALVHGVPVVASRIDGNVGLLGADWPALFPVGDRAALAELLLRWEADVTLREALTERTAALAGQFTPEHEQAAWQALLAEIQG